MHQAQTANVGRPVPSPAIAPTVLHSGAKTKELSSEEQQIVNQKFILIRGLDILSLMFSAMMSDINRSIKTIASKPEGDTRKVGNRLSSIVCVILIFAESID
jgi:hypothetical protein